MEGLGYANIGHRVVNLARLHNAPMFLAYNANRKKVVVEMEMMMYMDERQCTNNVGETYIGPFE